MPSVRFLLCLSAKTHNGPNPSSPIIWILFTDKHLPWWSFFSLKSIFNTHITFNVADCVFVAQNAFVCAFSSLWINSLVSISASSVSLLHVMKIKLSVWDYIECLKQTNVWIDLLGKIVLAGCWQMLQTSFPQFIFTKDRKSLTEYTESHVYLVQSQCTRPNDHLQSCWCFWQKSFQGFIYKYRK